ncbi:response regulator [Clostridium sartagoforme]|uniref:Transcriptional regulatory protein n=1 Tax=Clostridium sartagoforme TaxID=84031 RepID=A0A4S2DQC8_9CLOT|nr:response regulator [Clostridium sartagoforme]TGY44072.1 response regulator [Clostridium sartagoforme]
MSNIKVFIVEDDPMVKEINTRFLEKLEGFTVVGDASSIEEAKDKIIKAKADLILLDIFLPDGKGIDLLKWIRIKEINIDTILITADKCKASVDEAFKYGAIDYLIKPFKFERFKEALYNYKSRFIELRKVDNMNQDYIDQYILKINANPIEEEVQEKELCKGLSLKTYNKIIDYMTQKYEEYLTAEEIAQGSGLARVTARRYLEKMSEEGKVEINQEYGKIGRPTNYYILKK